MILGGQLIPGQIEKSQPVRQVEACGFAEACGSLDPGPDW